ncbi:MAG: catalase [Ignavibacteria bacterium]|nr:catalase [Ignavibacteria bacterium]
MKKKKLTTASGRPYFENEDSMTVGPRGPILLQDYYVQEKLAHFNRERIPERIVHAKGTGAFGTFKVTNNITKYTKAKLFNKVGNKCRVFVRFSTVGGEKGSADTERDPRGFAVKLYTEEGNWDLVGNNTPVFFIKDPKKFPDFIHTQKRDPKTNLKSPTMMWDYWSLNPESLHQVMILFSDRGTPDGYRRMNGYGSHTFSMINKKNKRVWVKYHFKTVQGNKTLTGAQAEELKGKDPDYAQRDLVEAITKKDFPKWALKIQVMTDEQSKKFRWNPFDVTKVWPHNEYPLIDVGVMELNEIPANYFADVEQAAFAPAHVVDGIGLSPDKMLQGRIFAYPDAHRYRLGANYEQIPVNRPICPVHNHQRDGMMNTDGNSGDSPNYFPNSFDNIEADKNYKEPAMKLDSDFADTYDRNENDDDYYTQPGDLFRKVMTDSERQNTISNIVGGMSGISGSKRDEIIQRQLSHFFKADKELALSVAKGLDFKFKK